MTHELALFVKTASKVDVAVTLERVRGFVSNMSKTELAAYSATGYKVWFATVGPLDMLYSPAGSFIAELTYNKADAVGFKQSFFVNVPSVKEAYEWMAA